MVEKEDRVAWSEMWAGLNFKGTRYALEASEEGLRGLG